MSYITTIITVIGTISSLCPFLFGIIYFIKEHKKITTTLLKEGKDYITADNLATNCLIDRANGLKEFVACICSTFRQLFDKSSKN